MRACAAGAPFTTIRRVPHPRRRFVRWWLAFALASIGLVARADDRAIPWFVRVWKVSEGLAGDYIAGIAQTDDGFIWVVGGGRLERFDGAALLHCPISSFAERPDDRIREMVRTQDGGLALALFDGTLLHVGHEGVQTIATGLAHENLRMEALCQAPDATYYATFSDGSVYQVRSGKTVPLTEAEGLPPGGHCRFVVDRSGLLWFSKGDYVGVRRGEKFETVRKFGDGSNPRVAAAREGGVWIAEASHLLRSDDGAPPQPVATLSLKNVAVRPNALLEDRTGAVWLGTYASGLFRYDGARFDSVPISHRQVVSLMEDREGSMWVGTSGGGLNQVQPRAVTIEGGETGVPYEAVVAMAEDDRDQLWGFTQAGVLVARHDGAWQPVPEFAGRGSVNAIATGPEATLWVSTRNGFLYRWRAGRIATWGRSDGLLPPNQRVLLATRTGDLWLGSSHPGALQRLRGDKLETIALPRPLILIRALAEDATGDIWVAASDRMLFRLGRDGAMVDETAGLAGAPNSANLLQPKPDGTLWIGFAGGGIGRLKDGRLDLLTTKQGLITDHIEVMLLDGRGWIWCVGGEAIFKVSEAEAAAVMDGHARRVQPVRYGEEQGVHPNFGEVIGAVRRHDGKLWIPMATSLAIIDPAQQRTLADPPPVWITDVTIDERPVASYHGVLPLRAAPELAETPLRIAPDHRRIEIAFTALSFQTPTNVAFRYKLENFDDQWTDAGPRRNASYSRLAAGHYRFRVIACNSDGVWNQSGATFAFVVEPFFWETWWFRSVVLAAFTAAVYLMARLISNRRLRHRLRAVEQEAAIERERARIARDIHDDLGSRLTRIVLLSGLAAREADAPEKSSERAKEISDTARQLIHSLDETVWAVNPKNDTLPHFVSYVGQFAVTFLRTAEIACELDLPEDPPALPLTADVRHNLFLAVKEALNNVVRHARATRVWLRVAVTASVLEISIADDGQGFAGDPTDPGADGLGNMRQRLAQIGGSIRIDSRPGAGTHVTFTVPRPNELET